MNKLSRRQWMATGIYQVTRTTTNHIGRRVWRVVGVLAITLLGVSTWAPTPVYSAWTIGKPIVSLLGRSRRLRRPGCQTKLLMAACNLVWVHSFAELSLAQEHGLRGLFYGPQDDQTIAQIRNHPALFAYYVADEPSASAFAGLGATVSRLRTLDPNHPAYIQPPAHAMMQRRAQLGTPNYATYLDNYVSSVQPSLLSYDQIASSYTGSDSPDYFKNLAMISHTAKSRQRCRSSNIVQGCA